MHVPVVLVLQPLYLSSYCNRSHQTSTPEGARQIPKLTYQHCDMTCPGDSGEDECFNKSGQQQKQLFETTWGGTPPPLS
eukprot:2006176-Heterocapsa_arctica.AAC.1